MLRLQLLHEVPGRLRARCPELRQEPGLAPRLEELARDLPAIEEVTVRPATGSVILRYNLEETGPAAFMQSLARRVEVTPPSPGGAAAGSLPLAERGTVGACLIRGLRRWWDQADREVYLATGGTLDLRSSVPLVMFILAARQLIRGGNLPALPWFTALYYGWQGIMLYRDPPPPEPRRPASASRAAT